MQDSAEYEKDRPVGQGPDRVGVDECLELISARCGVPVETIWAMPENEELVSLRSRPNVLLPGDRLTLPPKARAPHQVQAGRRYRFVVPTTLCKLRVSVAEHGQVKTETPFAFFYGGEKVAGGTVDATGIVECEVPIDAKVVHLLLGGILHPLAVRALNPVATPSGAQQRLINLGYAPGKVDGILGPRTKAALRAFQRDLQLTETGALDRSTQDRLHQAHGS